MSNQPMLETSDVGNPTYKICPCRHCTIQQKDVDIRHMKHARAGSVPNCPMSAETSICGRTHTCDAFPEKTVHLVVDSGELDQPDDAYGLGGVARCWTYDGRHTSLADAQHG